MRAMWIWLLCVVAVVALRPEHDIHIHETAMNAHTQKITEEMEEANSEKDFPVPRCIVKNREPAARSKDKTSCKGKSERKDASRECEKCKWCATKWQCPGREEYWSRRWTIEPMGGSLTPVEVWVSEICQSPLSSTLETSKPVSLWGLYGANRKKLSFAKCALLEYLISLIQSLLSKA